MYKTKKIIKPIIDFIKTCPFLEEFNIDISDIDTQRFSTERPPGAALDYVGSTIPKDKQYISGVKETTRQANFQIWLIRQSNDNLYRTEIADFLFNFEQWVEDCQFNGTTPKIGDIPIDEVMWADNGMFFSEWEGQETSQYMIQLHILYKKDYYYDDYEEEDE